jgi:hypothetical protein
MRLTLAVLWLRVREGVFRAGFRKADHRVVAVELALRRDRVGCHSAGWFDPLDCVPLHAQLVAVELTAPFLDAAGDDPLQQILGRRCAELDRQIAAVFRADRIFAIDGIRADDIGRRAWLSVGAGDLAFCRPASGAGARSKTIGRSTRFIQRDGGQDARFMLLRDSTSRSRSDCLPDRRSSRSACPTAHRVARKLAGRPRPRRGQIPHPHPQNVGGQSPARRCR